MKTLKSSTINFFLVLFMCCSMLGCDHGGFTIGEVKGTIDVPGQRAIVVLLVFILLALAVIAWFGYERVFKPLTRIRGIESSIASAAEKIRSETDIRTEINKLRGYILDKEREIGIYKGEIKLLKEQRKNEEEKVEILLEKYKREANLDAEQRKKELKAEETKLIQKIAGLENYIELCAYYLAKYKINIYGGGTYEFDVQKRVWFDQIFLGHIGMVLDNMYDYYLGVQDEESKNIVFLQKGRFRFLEEEFRQGRVTSSEYLAEINRINKTIKEFLEGKY